MERIILYIFDTDFHVELKDSLKRTVQNAS